MPITVNAVNDAPSIVSPRSQQIKLSGYNLEDRDHGSVGQLSVTISAGSKFSQIKLGDTAGITFTHGSIAGAFNNTVHFSGNVQAVKQAINGMEYVRRPAFDGSDTVTIAISDHNATTGVQTTSIDLAVSNYVNQVVPSVTSASPRSGVADGRTNVTVRGSNFGVSTNLGLFCQFDLVMLNMRVFLVHICLILKSVF